MSAATLGTHPGLPAGVTQHDLDDRGPGDVPELTLQEVLANGTARQQQDLRAVFDRFADKTWGDWLGDIVFDLFLRGQLPNTSDRQQFDQDFGDAFAQAVKYGEI